MFWLGLFVGTAAGIFVSVVALRFLDPIRKFSGW